MSCRAAQSRSMHAQSNLMTIPALYSTQKAWNQIIQAGLSVCGYKDKNRPFEASHPA